MMIWKFLSIFLLNHLVYAAPINEPLVIENATQTESPWYVYMEIHGARCGGSLVNDQYVVTAAHCFDSLRFLELEDETELRKAVKIRIGEWNTETDPDCPEGAGGQLCDTVAEIPPKAVVIHKGYKKNTGWNKYKNDIAMVKLSWPPRKSVLIQNIGLPDSDECYDLHQDETWTVTGFGQLPNKKYATIKKKIDLRMISHEECENDMGDAQEFYDKKTHICGKGTRSESTCEGDSGSGVATRTNGDPILQGIVSFGVRECGSRNAPSGFVRAACFVDWIEEQIEYFEEDESNEV